MQSIGYSTVIISQNAICERLFQKLFFCIVQLVGMSCSLPQNICLQKVAENVFFGLCSHAVVTKQNALNMGQQNSTAIERLEPIPETASPKIIKSTDRVIY